MYGFANRSAVLSRADAENQIGVWRAHLAKERREIEALQRRAARKYGGQSIPSDSFAAAKASDALDEEAGSDGYSYREKAQRISAIADLIAGLEQLAIVAEYRGLDVSNDSPDVKSARKRRAELERDHRPLLVAENVIA